MVLGVAAVLAEVVVTAGVVEAAVEILGAGLAAVPVAAAPAGTGSAVS